MFEFSDFRLRCLRNIRRSLQSFIIRLLCISFFGGFRAGLHQSLQLLLAVFQIAYSFVKSVTSGGRGCLIVHVDAAAKTLGLFL